MFYLIGLGLTEKDISFRAFEILKKVDKVYVDTYTNFFDYDFNWLKSEIKVKIILLSREDIEQTPTFLDEAKDKAIALLVSGDPLVATTHTDILLRARKNGIKTEILHASSIYSAISVTGLHIYRFGKTASIPYPEDNFFPKSFYDTILDNLNRNLHTMLLLDIKREKNLFMSPKEALDILEELDSQRIIKKIIIASRIGQKSQKIIYGDIRDIIKLDKGYYGNPPHTIVIPADLHFAEEEFILSNAEIYKNSKI